MGSLGLIDVTTQCTRCGREIVVPMFPGRDASGFYCETCAEALNEARRREEFAAIREADFRRRVAASGIPEELVEFDPHRAWNFGEVRDWIREHRRESLFIASRTSGIGKTRGAAAMAYRMMWEDGIEVVWMTAPEWLRHTCMLMGDGERSGRTADARVRAAKRCDLLVIDDLGTEVVTARAAEITWEIIDARTRNHRRRLTWVTTNCSGEELAKRLGAVGPKTLRRLRDVCLAWSPKNNPGGVS